MIEAITREALLDSWESKLVPVRCSHAGIEYLVDRFALKLFLSTDGLDIAPDLQIILKEEKDWTLQDILMWAMSLFNVPLHPFGALESMRGCSCLLAVTKEKKILGMGPLLHKKMWKLDLSIEEKGGRDGE